MPEVISNLPQLLGVVVLVVMLLWFAQRFPNHRVVINEQEWALHYKSGRFAKVLAPGVHHLWGKTRVIWADASNYDPYGHASNPQNRGAHKVVLLEKRQMMEQLTGQEVLTKDTIGLKLSLVVFYHVADPQKCYQVADDYRVQLYNLVQLGLRAAVGAKTMDELLEDRESVGKQAHDLIRERVSELGLEIVSLDVRDVMLSKEIRSAYASVVAAQKEGLAALERARGEQAALRNMANAAQMLKNNPELMQLRLLQALSAEESGTKNFVIGLPVESGLGLPDTESSSK